MRLVVTIFCLVLSVQLFAQFNGELDGAFSTDGYSYFSISNNDEIVYNSTIQADGKILLVGSTGASGSYNGFVARLNANGNLDSTFAINGIYTFNLSSNDDMLFDIGLQSSGKIIVTGTTKNINNRDNLICLRLTSTGMLDISFAVNGIRNIDLGLTSVSGRGLEILDDNSILIAGNLGGLITIFKLTSQGFIDDTFNEVGYKSFNRYTTSSTALGVVADNNGSIYLYGTGVFDGLNLGSIIKLDLSGNEITTFADNGYFEFNPYAIVSIEKVIFTNNKLIGIANSQSGYSHSAQLFCIDTVGEFSNDFSSTYTDYKYAGFNTYFYGLTTQPDGKIVTAGYYYTGSKMYLLVNRFHSDGVIDVEFGNNGAFVGNIGSSDNILRSVEISNSGNIVASGYGFTGSTGNDAIILSLKSYDTSLPVELVYFDYYLANSLIIINWQTASEINNYGFVLEGSNENGAWEFITFIEGGGNSTSKRNYQQKLKHAHESYRLKQIDFSGKVNIVGTIETNDPEVKILSLISLYPNPFNPSTNITLRTRSNSHIVLSIFNILGEQVDRLHFEFEQEGVQRVTYNANHLSTGIYFYQISDGLTAVHGKLNFIK